MAGLTPNLGLELPTVGANRDTWGTLLNGNFNILDDYVSVAMPIGSVLDFAGPQAPQGFLICDGRSVSRTTYSDLFAVIGTNWGVGDGSTTFSLPNPNGRSSVGPGTVTDAGGRTRAFTFGAQNIGYVWNVIGQTHLPNYALPTDVQGYHAHGGATVAAGAHYHVTDAQGQHSHSGATAGNNVDHTHGGYTDAQGNHAHNVPAQGGTSAGSPPSAFLWGGIAAYIQTDTQGSHQHNIQTYGASTSHVHGIYDDGSHAHTTSWVGDHGHGIYGDGSHAHNVSLNGGGTPFEVQSPVIVMTKIIHAGQQAVTRAATAALAATVESDELARIREELEQLRSLIYARRPQRVMSAPSRGMH
jgi:microcystin-dependent protein